MAVTDSETTMAVVAAVNNFWQKIGEFITNSPAFYKLSKTLLALRTRSSLVLHISYSLMEPIQKAQKELKDFVAHSSKMLPPKELEEIELK